MTKHTTIVDEFGRAFEQPTPEPPEAAMMVRRTRRINAGYDAALTTTEFENYWSNADRYDADSANSKDVRHTLISRSRKSINNNGYADGIAQTYATDLVGVGPLLRMQTGSNGFNRLIERVFYLWTQAIKFRRKLWCMAHAKYSDGEAFGVLRRNPGINHPIQLDVVLYEAEQIQTPFVPFNEPGYIDGIKFDQFGNPLFYDILKQHPGGTHGFSLNLEPERVPANLVLHWFKLRRPGQHRGVPECASTLNVGAAAHRWREATLAAAETAADINVMMTTQLTPDSTTDPMAPFSTLPIQKRMLTVAPMGWDAQHFKSEHPNASHEGFNKGLINEQARPKSMPYIKAACDASSSNYASGRLDHQGYYAGLDVEREDCNDVLDQLFNIWFDVAIGRFGWLGGDASAVGPAARVHTWDWPKHRVADVEAEANANRTRLESGQVFAPRLFSDSGMDFEDECESAAAAFGIPVEEVKRRLFDVLLPPPKTDKPKPANQEPMVAALLNRMNGKANGVHHGN